ncbi:MAG: hypothetical protein HOI41_02440 [Acidimicrobiaceae bacterium]|nr:hypothetical protein [Acidimicrobiaceae bacterium]
MALAVSTPSPNYVDENTTLAGIRADLTRLSERGLAPADSVQAAALLEELEAIERQSNALCIDLMGAIDRAGLHYDDGTRRPRSWPAMSPNCLAPKRLVVTGAGACLSTSN